MVFEDWTDRAPSLPFVLHQVLAGPHENFHYIIGDPETKEGAFVDPAFEIDSLFKVAEASGLRIRDAFFTHMHWDHVGGIPDVIERGVDRVYVHEAARAHPKVEDALNAGAEVGLASDGDTVMVGNVPVQALHTPGHQPESTCYLAGAKGPRALFGGDTLFVGSCGRTDFPGGDTEAMFASLTRLRALTSPDIHLMPGHHYAERSTRPLSVEADANPALATKDRQAFGDLPFLRG